MARERLPDTLYTAPRHGLVADAGIERSCGGNEDCRSTGGGHVRGGTGRVRVGPLVRALHVGGGLPSPVGWYYPYCWAGRDDLGSR